MNHPQLENLISIVQKLRDPKQGCPWDLKQTLTSLLPYLTEESYEYIAAVEAQDQQGMQEELGDVLLQVLLHSTIADQQGLFTLESVAQTLAEKLVYRHPHVFKKEGAKLDEKQVLQQWEELKDEKRQKTTINASHLALPALLSGEKIGKESQKIGFDWEDYSQVLYKVEEEWQELKEELPPSGHFNLERVEEELGDLLFSLVQLARHLNLSAESVLRKANRKFVERFQKMENLITQDQTNLTELSLEQKEEYWNKVKQQSYDKTST